MGLPEEKYYLPLNTGVKPPPNPRRLARFLIWLSSSATIIGLWAWSNKISPPVALNHGHGKHPLFGKAAEREFLSVPDEASAIRASRVYASKPHMAGTPGDFDTAAEFLSLLQRELGIAPPDEFPIFDAGSHESRKATLSASHVKKPQAWIDKYYPVMNTPLGRNIQVLHEDGSIIWEADLVEFSDATDPDAGKYFDDVPTFHGLSRGGDVTGRLIDGNYCTKEDYDRLASEIDMKGSIVLCRYGGIFRGLKVKGGQEHGAVGVLIYSDPKDDGTVTVENGYQPYPYGPARNPTSVQRGSVQYLSVYPGDPTTPGYPSYANSTRIEATNIPSIPSLPISWYNAQQLFRTLAKEDAWEGKSVRLVNNVNTGVIPIWNTMGVIPGFLKDEVIVIGNHRDAWVLGAVDPSSGTASVHEVVRGLGKLLKKGWKPLRTIVIASWDAEEYGLIGSTEWGEDFASWIEEHVVAYLNLDSSVSGSRFGVSGSPLLSHFLKRTAEDVSHPHDNERTLWDATKDTGALFGLLGNGTVTLDPEVLRIREMEVSAADYVGVSPLGSGSDYTVFLQRNGVPSANGGFGATPHDPAYHYHSVFDSERWQELYGDPGFSRHVAISKYLGLQTLRLASNPLLPFNATHYAFEVGSYLDRVESLASQASLDVQFRPLRKTIHSLQKAAAALDKERYKAEDDLIKFVEKWKKKHRKHGFMDRVMWRLWCRSNPSTASGSGCRCPGYQSISAADAKELEELGESIKGIAYHSGLNSIRIAQAINGGKRPLKRLRKIVKRLQKVNKKALAVEKGFISEEGIKDREWYKHLAVAPGKWLGYGATTLPGLSEAITYEKNAKMAQHEADRLQRLISKLAKAIQV